MCVSGARGSCRGRGTSRICLTDWATQAPLSWLFVFSCSSLSFLKTAILNSFLDIHCRSPCVWDRLLEDYCDPLVVSYFLDFLYSLKFCIAVFAFEVVFNDYLSSVSKPDFFLFFFLRWCAETFLQEIWFSRKPLSSMGDYLRQCFPGAPRCSWEEGAEANLWAIASSTAGNVVSVPVIQCMVGKTFSRSLGIWCLIPQLLQRGP